MGHIYALVLVTVSVADADAVQAQNGKAAMLDPAHRTVRLVRVGYTVTRAHNLIARFADVGTTGAKEIEVVFAPVPPTAEKTIAYASHLRTIYKIVFCSVSWRRERRTPFDVIDWHEPQFEIIFSIPKDAQEKVSDFSRWYLVSLALPHTRQERPKPPNK